MEPVLQKEKKNLDMVSAFGIFEREQPSFVVVNSSKDEARGLKGDDRFDLSLDLEGRIKGTRRKGAM